MKISKSSLSLAAALFFGPVIGHATLLINEQFSYLNGDLTTVSGGNWSAYSDPGMSPIQILGGAAIVTPANPGAEDDLRVTGSTLAGGGTLYGSFDVSVAGGNNQTYFSSFATSGGSSLSARVFITTFSGSDFTFGLRTSDTVSPVKWGSGLSFSTIYNVAFSYTYDTGVSRLWVNPTSELSTSITDGGTALRGLGSVVLRQGGGSGTQTIDNLRVGTNFADVVPVPEPSAVALLGVGLAGVVFMARRRRLS